MANCLVAGDDGLGVDPALGRAHERELGGRLELRRYAPRSCVTAPRWASSPIDAAFPPGATICPFTTRRSLALAAQALAAVAVSCPLATAAATRTWLKIECIVFEPPVNWLKTSCGIASASVMFTLSSGSPISSAIVIATAVVIPCPDLGARKRERHRPVGVDGTVMSGAVGNAASVRRSLRS